MAKNFEILDGVYKGPRHYSGWLDLGGTYVSDLGSLESVGGYLDLMGSITSDSDLGSLKSVGGDLYLWDTSVTSLGCLESVGGSLDLENTAISDLGSLKSVGGSLRLRGTAISSLESLESVGGYLDLRGTSVSDLGSLKFVGRCIYTDDSKHYSFQELKALVQKIEDSSISALVERLHVEEDPFLKIVIERRLCG